MKITKPTAIILSIILGISIALFFRSGAIAISPDFKYVQIFNYRSVDLYVGGTQDNPSGMIGWSYVGKPIISTVHSGFPLPRFSDCTITDSGLVSFVPRCEVFSVFGEMATVFNAFFWSGVAYGIIHWICSVILPKSPDLIA